MAVETEPTALMLPGEAASFLRISRRALLDNAAAGVVPVIRVNARVVRFRRADLEALSNEQAPDGPVERLRNHGAGTPHGTA
jgi:citrate lyase beta subunit